MTIPVSIEQLPATLGTFGSAQLLTLASTGSVRVHTVDPTVVDGQVRVVCEHRSPLENAERDPRVTLVWAPLQRHGWTLILDGMASVDGDELVVEVASAILHRPHSHDDGPEWVFPQ